MLSRVAACELRDRLARVELFNVPMSSRVADVEPERERLTASRGGPESADRLPLLVELGGRASECIGHIMERRRADVSSSSSSVREGHGSVDALRAHLVSAHPAVEDEDRRTREGRREDGATEDRRDRLGPREPEEPPECEARVRREPRHRGDARRVGGPDLARRIDAPADAKVRRISVEVIETLEGGHGPEPVLRVRRGAERGRDSLDPRRRRRERAGRHAVRDGDGIRGDVEVQIPAPPCVRSRDLLKGPDRRGGRRARRESPRIPGARREVERREVDRRDTDRDPVVLRDDDLPRIARRAARRDPARAELLRHRAPDLRPVAVEEPEDVREPTAGERLSRRGHDDVDAAALEDRLAEELRDIDAAEERWILRRLRLRTEDERTH